MTCQIGDIIYRQFGVDLDMYGIIVGKNKSVIIIQWFHLEGTSTYAIEFIKHNCKVINA